MRFIKFNDQQVDSFLFMELSDLAKALTKQADIEVDYSVQSYLDPVDRKIFISHFWDHREKSETVEGFKSDIFLRSIGNFYYTNFKEIGLFLQKIDAYKLKSFAKQLCMLLEDIRLEEICIKDRPGTKKAFNIRKKLYRKHFQGQLTIHQERNILTDALFNYIYLKLTSESLEEIPLLSESLDRTLPYIDTKIFSIYEAKSTTESIKIVLDIMDVLEEILDKDMLNTYFYLAELAYETFQANTLFEELKRKSKLKNKDSLKDAKSGDEDVHEDKLPTWHSETSKPTKSFLQFELEQGTNTTINGDGTVREGEDTDQALAMVQGTSKKAKKNDYSKLEALENKSEERATGGELAYGKENKYAIPIFIDATSPKANEIDEYTENRTNIMLFQNKLKLMILKTLEHKRTMPRTDLHIGRLNKKFLRLLTDDNPKLFYKKQEKSPEIDAAFTLLVDCSASMYDKMDQTKLGITLFHETLKSVRVPHQIVGFWEDTNEATKTYQPNHFHKVITFEKSLNQQSGPEIMQLKPEEDNRDGYAIRHMTKQLSRRQEKQKFLLVFSDGEPAAMGYERNGIIDTHESVLEARKMGIEVLNVFLSTREIDEATKNTIQNIYGRYSVFVEKIEELPEQLFPLLKRLLLNTI
ncbi:nitric oxide reductase activation protein [Metabacillus crassostreae]|uniref:vWA domain-containing protein n=1 Tax=Metabacillus crassostreae TaxID=929098 RepID=UPI00195E115E|nr:VWA domain-containing protein [Metabacillus crassostreae]MBM7602159.1 nitric oxide reductase activation protein [Metabacillus crassostreae]